MMSRVDTAIRWVQLLALHRHGRLAYRVWSWTCSLQGWRARRRGDIDMGVNGPGGRFTMSRGTAEKLRQAIQDGTIPRISISDLRECREAQEREEREDG